MVTLRNLLSVFFAGLSVAGLSYQVCLILESYLAYRTVTVVVNSLPALAKPLDLSVCLRYSQVFDYERYNRENPENILIKDHGYMHENITIRKIFEYTPPTSQLFDSCIIRYPGDFMMTDIEDDQCSEKLSVTKFITQGLMCYQSSVQLSENMSHSYIYAQVSRSLEYMGTLFSIRLNITASFMKMALHDWKIQPVYSIMFCPYVSLKYDGSDIITEQFALTSSFVNITSLAPPYDTMCRNYEPEYMSQAFCNFACLRKLTMEKLDKTPYETFETDTELDKKHVSRSDIRNATIAKILFDIGKTCADKCRQTDCVKYFYITKVIRSPLSKYEPTRIFVDMSREPSLYITFKAVMAKLDLVIYVLSSAGTWLGISVLSLNPTRWLPLLWKKPAATGVHPFQSHL
ncbi:hypothetical protein HDE_14072 [Halotydeus destructor]|nr:hypothetical protein HDE_14072 [Halotydeus destructor]